MNGFTAFTNYLEIKLLELRIYLIIYRVLIVTNFCQEQTSPVNFEFVSRKMCKLYSGK